MVVYFWYLYQINWLMELILFYLVVLLCLMFKLWYKTLSYPMNLIYSMPCLCLINCLYIFFSLIFLWFVCFHITNNFFDHLFCCSYQWLIVRHDPLAWSFLIGLIKKQCNIFIAFSHNSLLSAIKVSSSKCFVSHKIKLYQLFRSWPP